MAKKRDVKQRGRVAKLVASLLSSLGSNPDIPKQS